uniref:Dynein light intermediate chain n=1 Tax=Meloidogyne enterolobii TaxID=390850 RepID=A0A6V7XR09_MELEN|nr:unnamed protein product [Meloidogyne enterolobii]
MITGMGTNYLDGLPPSTERPNTIPSSQSDDGDELWLKILQEVSNKNNNAVRSSLIILGNERSGKSSLMSRLMGGTRKPMNSVLEYNYLQIHADASASYVYQLGGGANGLLGPTESATLPVWILDGREEMAPMLKFAFPPSLAKCVVILCTSLEQPGNVLPTLRRWYRLLDEQIRQHYSADEIFQAQQMQIRFWQEYVEPIESSLHSTATLVDGPSSNIGSMVGDQRPSSPLLLPPEKGILEENCGATLFVVITKSDLHTEFSTEQLDKVQYHVRQFCLRHGAALFYTSAKEDLNTQMLLKYIGHRIYALPFTTPAYIVEKDSIFVPTGWDSEQKLSIVKESLGYGSGQVPLLAQQNDTLLSFTNKNFGEKEIEAEDEQVFLNRLASMTAFDSSNPGQPRTGGQQSPRQGGKGTAGGQAGGGDSNNTMLANFFSSLLTKEIPRPASNHSNKSGDSSAPPTNAGSVDAEMHFKKMLANKKSGSTMTEGHSSEEKQEGNLEEDERDEEEEDQEESEEEINAKDEENNEDFEDVDPNVVNSSLDSKNHSPRTDSIPTAISNQRLVTVVNDIEQEDSKSKEDEI